MKNRLYRQWISALSILPLLALPGCGTFATKIGVTTEKLDQSGHPYAGVHHDLIWLKCSFFVPADAKERRDVPYWASVPLVPISLAISVIDIPYSFAADTLLLPVDFLVSQPPRNPRTSSSDFC